MLFLHLSVLLFKSLLFKYEFLCDFVKFVNMIAQVVGSCMFEQLSVEGRHMWLNVIEQESLEEVTSVHSHGNFFKEFCDGQVLRSNFILDQVEFVTN